MLLVVWRAPDAQPNPPFTDLSLHFIQLLDVDAVLLAEQHDQDRKTDRRLGGGDRHDEKDVYLAIEVAQVAGEGHEVEVHREQHELDAHQQQDHVLAVEKDARDAEREQQPGEHEDELELDHACFSASILTSRMRSFARTETCAAMS